jgi:hypothetical protein
MNRSMCVWIALLIAVAACSKSSDGTPTGPSAPTEPTITIAADGVTPKILTVTLGARVRIVNNDTQLRELQSNPHNVHTDCPAINRPGRLGPGQSGFTETFTVERACHYHEHATNNQDTRFRGQIVVGSAPAEPPQTGDGY